MDNRRRPNQTDSVSEIYKTQKVLEILDSSKAMQRAVLKDVLPEEVKNPLVFVQSLPEALIMTESSRCVEEEMEYYIDEIDEFETRLNVKIMEKDGDYFAVSKATGKPIQRPVPDAIKRYLRRGVGLPNIRHKGRESMLLTASQTSNRIWDEAFASSPVKKPLKDPNEPEGSSDHADSG